MQIQFYDIISNQVLVLLADVLLTRTFGKEARWYQLHVFGNLMVISNIMNETYSLYRDPFDNYKLLNNHNSSYLILSMHLHHMLFFKLNRMDYFHHIIFVLFGVVPTILLVNTNQIYLGYIACSGIPGAIEYSVLSLYKNNKITLYNQKKINAFVYNFLRYPMCIYGATINLLAYKYNNIITNDNFYVTLYINFLLYMNGCLFNYLTIKSYNTLIYHQSIAS